MGRTTTAEELFATVKGMPAEERARFFSMLGANAFAQDFTHAQVFGDLAGEEFTAGESAEYLEVSMATFRRHVQSGRLNPSNVVGRNQLFATKTLKAFKRSLGAVKGAANAGKPSKRTYE